MGWNAGGAHSRLRRCVSSQLLARLQERSASAFTQGICPKLRTSRGGIWRNFLPPPYYADIPARRDVCATRQSFTSLGSLCVILTALMFKKILIANRGEIAVRVMRACREMGTRTVAVYSEVDRASLHVLYADEAYPIGPAPATESYLRIDRILEVARRSGAKAVHPGYGFLAENHEFAAACGDAGLVFIGPPPEAMQLMGSKTASRQALREADLPVVPGTYESLESFEQVKHAAREVGYPLMLKASAGGGGKGLRRLTSPEELESAFHTARSEALNAFNDPGLFVERYLERPRHIEIQILGDHYGHLIYLGERECSLQRRHQKVMEESPSLFIDEPMRTAMGETAVRIAKLAHYTNAGTVEFLVDQDHNFYFLEMNTRLQVEHPVTELVVGLDLVKEQIRIAAGEPLCLRQEDIRLQGVALECRLYAEDPDNNFFPSPGLIRRLRTPPVRASAKIRAFMKDGESPSNMILCSRSS